MTPAQHGATARTQQDPGTAAIEVRRATRDDAPAIDAWASRSDRATFFHRPVWSRAVEAQFRHGDRSLVALRGGDVVGALPLSLVRGLRGGRDLVSTPYGVYGGPAGDDADVERALFAAAEADAVSLGVGRLELRCLEERGLDLPTTDLHATFIKDLPEDPADVLKGMPKKARADARKARKSHGLTLHEGRWYAADLARLFHRNKRSLGSPALPDAWFGRLLDDLGDRVTVHAVKRDGETLSAVMSFLFRDQVLAYYSGTAEAWTAPTRRAASCTWRSRNGASSAGTGSSTSGAAGRSPARTRSRRTRASRRATSTTRSGSSGPRGSRPSTRRIPARRSSSAPGGGCRWA